MNHVSSVNIVNVLSTRSGNVLIKSTNPKAAEKLQFLAQIIGDNNIRITAENRNHNTASQPRTPSFSCVITNVDHDVTLNEIKEKLQKDGHHIKTHWRIQSRATIKDTRLIRIITASQRTLDNLLLNGFTLFYQHHRVETSHAPRPQPIQCNRCQEFHPPDTCKKPIRCPRCTKQHHLNQCDMDANSVKCANCNQAHLAFSNKCPARPKEPTSAATTAPLKSVDSAEEDAPPVSVNDMLRFVTVALLNALPEQRSRIQTVLAALARQLFNTKIVVSYSGASIHVGCNPLPLYTKTYAQTTSAGNGQI